MIYRVRLARCISVMGCEREPVTHGLFIHLLNLFIYKLDGNDWVEVNIESCAKTLNRAKSQVFKALRALEVSTLIHSKNALGVKYDVCRVELSKNAKRLIFGNHIKRLVFVSLVTQSMMGVCPNGLLLLDTGYMARQLNRKESVVVRALEELERSKIITLEEQ